MVLTNAEKQARYRERRREENRRELALAKDLTTPENLRRIKALILESLQVLQAEQPAALAEAGGRGIGPWLDLVLGT